MAERLIVLALLAAAPALAQVAGLADPTRPPNAASIPGAAKEPAEAGSRRLQSVLISADRKLAMIDGQTVPLGGSVGDATLVQITETQVMLRRGAELTTLELYPGVVRRPAPAVENKNKEGRP